MPLTLIGLHHRPTLPLTNYSDIRDEREYATAKNETDNWNAWLFYVQSSTGIKSLENAFPDSMSPDFSPVLGTTLGLLPNSYLIGPSTPPPASYLRECTDAVGHLRRGEREPMKLLADEDNAEVFDSHPRFSLTA